MQRFAPFRPTTLAVLLVALAGAGCKDTSGPVAEIERIFVTPTELALAVGESRAVNVSIRDTEGVMREDVPVVWSTPDSTIVKFRADNTLVAGRPGRVTVGVSAGGASASVRVTVTAATGTP